MRKSNIEQIMDITKNIHLGDFSGTVQEKLEVDGYRVSIKSHSSVIFFNITNDKIKFLLSVELVPVPENTIPIYFETTTQNENFVSVSIFSNKSYLDENNIYLEDINYLMLGIMSESNYRSFPKEGNSLINDIHNILLLVQNKK